MAFLFAYDRKPLREEDFATSRAPSRQSSVKASIDTLGESPVQLGSKRDDGMDMKASSSSPASQRRHMVFPDPIAFRYLQEDPAVSVVEPRGILQGYELYLVEQWACSRRSPTSVIATYTGDSKHSIVVGVLSVPADESAWSSRLRVFVRALQQYHARPKDTSLGELMVTNLSSFPSAFTVILVPGGDIRKHQRTFMVNEDLKRLGCSGRSGLNLQDPTPATQAKFYQLYKVSERVSPYQAVLELVRLCQMALFLFGQLEQEYIDGLLCDVTESAISNWWTEIGAEYYNIEPSDGILGPTTVAALLGMLMGARNRLHSYGAPVPKDVFDMDSTMRAISSFQKYQKLERTKHLDRQTLHQLQSVTAKAAASEGWGVQRAVKSTVAEIGGKRGEIVIGMVGGKDKAGIGEIETLDLDKFIALASGERAKWLWHGKPRRSTSEYGQQSIRPTTSFGKEDVPAQIHKRTQPPEDEAEASRREDPQAVYASPPPSSTPTTGDSPNEKDALRKTVFKSVAGRMSDARSGLGRIKGAVGGGRRHGARTSKDELLESGISSPGMTSGSASLGVVTAPPAVGRAFTWKNKPEEYLNAMRREEPERRESPDQVDELGKTKANGEAGHGRDSDKAPESLDGFASIASEVRRELVQRTPSAAGSTVEDGDLLGPLLVAERSLNAPLHHLQRRHSIELSRLSLRQPVNESRWPRRLSFGDAEEAVLRWDEVVDDLDAEHTLEDVDALRREKHLEELARNLNQSIAAIKRDLEPWVMKKIEAVEELDDQYGREQGELQTLSYQLTEAYQHIKVASSELVAEERSHLAEAIRELEVLLARLEYEISSLVSKVEDVEEGIQLFEKQVENVERRAEELKAQLETESWLHWFVRTLTGIGTGPNITRERRR